MDLQQSNQESNEPEQGQEPLERQELTQSHQPTPVELAPEEAFDFSQETGKIDLSQPVSWQATEGAQVKRDSLWYGIFGIVTLGLMALAIFVFKSWTFAVLLPVMAVAVITLSSRPPRTINYAVSPKGVYVGDRLYDFSEFRAFGVTQEQDHNSATLLPVKRFSPGLTIYFNTEDGERVVDMLGARLPIQEVKPDLLERLIRAIRL